MANKTLLDAVNEILRRVQYIAGDAGVLTSLTDSARQSAIDIAKQIINEGISEVYTTSQVPLPTEQAESTVTLVTNTRAYALATDLEQLRFPLIDKTHTQFIYEFPGGYNEMLRRDPEQDDTGLPHLAAIRPTDGKLHMDRAPTSVDNGNVYTYQYDKNLGLTLATDNVPFGDPVFFAMVPVWAQLWKRAKRKDFDQGLFASDVGKACRLLTNKQVRESWSPR